MKIYNKTLEEAVANYNQNGQETPKAWIYEKYGVLFKHLMLSESIDSGNVIRYMREDYLPLEQAIEKYIIRKNAQKDDLDKDWMEELYDLLSDALILLDNLSKVMKQILNFFVKRTFLIILLIQKRKQRNDSYSRITFTNSLPHN